MPALHEVLAVERDLENVSKKLRTESIKTLGKESLFNGQVRTLTMFDEAQAMSNSIEHQELTTTVNENLEYLVDKIAEYWDVVATKDATNQNAVADIIIDGQVLVSDVPVNTLLGLEQKLGELRAVYEAIKTLPPGIKWIADTQSEKPGVFVSVHPEVSFKTEQTIKGIELSPATKEHPAQVQSTKVVTNIGKYEITRQCGMMTPLGKAEKIERLDILLRAVKKARMRANSVEVKDFKLGHTLLGFINGQ
jgi:hypothetical protein